MEPSKPQFDNVISIKTKQQDKAIANSPFGPIQAKIVTPITKTEE
jgi:hypothetical protein